MPQKYIFDPSNAPEEILIKAKVELGKTYPYAMVDLAETRDAALKNFKLLPT